MFEQVFYLVIVTAGIIVALVTKDDTFVWIVGILGVIATSFFVAMSLGMIAWIAGAILAAFIVGYAAADELRDGRRWFMVLLGMSVVLMIAGIVKNDLDISNLAGIVAIFSGLSFALSFTKLAKTSTSKI